jgi:hypothetical protein
MRPQVSAANTKPIRNSGVLDTIWAALQETGPARGEHHPHQERHRT